MIDVESLDLLNFKDQTFLEIISGVILNIFNVKYKVETIFSTGQSGNKTSRISKKINIINKNNIEKYDLSF